MKKKPAIYIPLFILILFLGVFLIGPGYGPEGKDDPLPVQGEKQVGIHEFSRPGFFLAAPEGPDSGKLIIIYPGGFVRPESYLWAAEALSSFGHLAAVAKMPLNLAALSPGRPGE